MAYKVGMVSLGCAKNQVDCERMMFRVQEAGYTVSDGVVDCDVVVINTCGFIDSAKSEAIDHILRVAELKKAGRVGKILVTGCLSQRYPDEIRQELPEVAPDAPCPSRSARVPYPPRWATRCRSRDHST